MLKSGFKHCFCVIDYGGIWLKIEARKGVPVVQFLAMVDKFNLADYFRNQGIVVETTCRNISVSSPFVLRNCVGLVKSFLCLKSMSVTPYSLYKYLLRHN